jgi:hypothetical protein
MAADDAKLGESTETLKIFAEALNDLATVGGFSNHVSQMLTGLPAEGRADELASMVHAKMSAHARSIGALCQSSMFDHSAIVGLARMMIECMTTFFYLKEKLSPDEWSLRWLILSLHDTVSRIKLMRAWRPKVAYADLTAGRASLVEEIKRSTVFRGLVAEQQERLLTGEEIFVGGMRRAATRAAGWREETFAAIYNYFSVHVHSAPMSYMRMRSQKIDYLDPSTTQIALAVMAIAVARDSLRRVSVHRLNECPPELLKKMEGDLLSKIRREDTECNTFTSGDPSK